MRKRNDFYERPSGMRPSVSNEHLAAMAERQAEAVELLRRGREEEALALLRLRPRKISL